MRMGFTTSRRPDLSRRQACCQGLGLGAWGAALGLWPSHAAKSATKNAALSAGMSTGAGGAAPAAGASQPPPPRLSRDQTAAFRAWFVAIVSDQVMRPSPRWVHRDCAGLVRFAVAEALRPHDARWQHAMGWPADRLPPPDVALRPDQADLARGWATPDGQRSAFAPALAMVQLNTRPVGKDRTQALPGDLLFFDQGDDQHLMVWTGRAVAYHTGAAPNPHPDPHAQAPDNGLRWQRWERLMTWPDTRWRPSAQNPNFAGLYRLAFLADAA
jgi:uncharacterized protein YfaT (DUF1175 family)